MAMRAAVLLAVLAAALPAQGRSLLQDRDTNEPLASAMKGVDPCSKLKGSRACLNEPVCHYVREHGHAASTNDRSDRDGPDAAGCHMISVLDRINKPSGDKDTNRRHGSVTRREREQLESLGFGHTELRNMECHEAFDRRDCKRVSRAGATGPYVDRCSWEDDAAVCQTVDYVQNPSQWVVDNNANREAIQTGRSGCGAFARFFPTAPGPMTLFVAAKPDRSYTRCADLPAMLPRLTPSFTVPLSITFDVRYEHGCMALTELFVSTDVLKSSDIAASTTQGYSSFRNWGDDGRETKAVSYKLSCVNELCTTRPCGTSNVECGYGSHCDLGRRGESSNSVEADYIGINEMRDKGGRDYSSRWQQSDYGAHPLSLDQPVITHTMTIPGDVRQDVVVRLRASEAYREFEDEMFRMPHTQFTVADGTPDEAHYRSVQNPFEAGDTVYVSINGGRQGSLISRIMHNSNAKTAEEYRVSKIERAPGKTRTDNDYDDRSDYNDYENDGTYDHGREFTLLTVNDAWVAPDTPPRPVNHGHQYGFCQGFNECHDVPAEASTVQECWDLCYGLHGKALMAVDFNNDANNANCCCQDSCETMGSCDKVFQIMTTPTVGDAAGTPLVVNHCEAVPQLTKVGDSPSWFGYGCGLRLAYGDGVDIEGWDCDGNGLYNDWRSEILSVDVAAGIIYQQAGGWKTSDPLNTLDYSQYGEEGDYDYHGWGACVVFTQWGSNGFFIAKGRETSGACNPVNTLGNFRLVGEGTQMTVAQYLNQIASKLN